MPQLAPSPQPQRFRYRSHVFFDELDAMAVLHNARYPIHMERATSALHHSLGDFWRTDVTENPDQFHVVRELSVEYLAPLRGGEVDIEVWVERLGTTSCVYRYRFVDGDRVHARGRRAVVKVDAATLRPVPWSERFLESHRPLVEERE
jgi:acyl-CoA thioester hydrolase